MTTALSRTDGDLHLDTWTMMKEQAGMLVKTGFLPTAIKTPEQAVAIMLKGNELRIPSMYALSNIAVIQGKPVCNAELMLALIYRDHGDEAIRFPQSDHERCTIAYRRRSWHEPQTYSFTIADAQRAGLTSNQTWHKYPAAMLRARCISAVARLAFPDSIGGMYTPEELGAAVTVNDEGAIEVLDVTPPPQVVRPMLTAPDPEVEAAEAAFWEQFGGVLGYTDWAAAQAVLNTKRQKPNTVDGWSRATQAMHAALKAETKQAA